MGSSGDRREFLLVYFNIDKPVIDQLVWRSMIRENNVTRVELDEVVYIFNLARYTIL